jgi:ribosomal protein S18 acetylase RimI-like enzyme
VVRIADQTDADDVGRLLHAFNLEYGDPTPGPERMAARVRELIGRGEVKVLLAGDGPAGVALMRFRSALWTDGLECYLEELYVAPDRRGQGLGRALMEAAIELARGEGADRMDLCTSDDDVTARALYESLGFVNRERPPAGPVMYYYEREL